MKRINPVTNLPFKRNDLREDGLIFWQYNKTKSLNSLGYYPESWVSKSYKNKKFCVESASIKQKVTKALNSIKHRAKKHNTPFDLTVEYLLSILPVTCPVFKTKLDWGKYVERINTASLDRIDSEKGYVVGNVMWMSVLANTMKNNATNKQLLNFSDWVNKNYSHIS